MRILVVGGGTGGTILANNLARRLAGEIRAGKVRLTMLSDSDRHMYQPGLLYVAFGQMTPDQLYRDQASMLEPSVGFHVDAVTEFHLDKNQVKTKSGKTYEYDILAIATGARIVPQEVPGMSEGAENFLRKRALSGCTNASWSSRAVPWPWWYRYRTNAPWRRWRPCSCCTISSRRAASATR